jgi:hypothetical protein
MIENGKTEIQEGIKYNKKSKSVGIYKWLLPLWNSNYGVFKGMKYIGLKWLINYTKDDV